jgi:hypothetical protein
MYRRGQALKSHTQLGKSKRTSTRWQSASIGALLLVGLTAGVVVAAGTDWPAWAGTPPANISNSTWDETWQPVVATGSSGQVLVAWSDEGAEGAERDIYARLSDDNGVTWLTAPQVISATVRDSVLPDALIAENRCFVAWVDLDGGPVALHEAEITGTGTIAVRPIVSPLPLADTQPRLGASAGNLHVVFNAGDPSHIVYATRPLTSTTWPTATVLYTPTNGFEFGSLFPTLALDPAGETLHLAWIDIGYDTRTIRYMRWSAGSFYTHALSSEAPANTTWGRPSIAADSSGNLHVVWEEEVGTGPAEGRDRYVRYTRYSVSSGSWTSPTIRIYSEPVRVNADDPRNIVPALTLVEKDDEVTVCVAWHGFRVSGLYVGAEEILLICSEDGGRSWPSLPHNVSRSPEAEEISIMPSVAFGPSGRLHGVWQERSQFLHYEIYYTYSLGNRVFLPLMMRNK